MSRYYNNYPVGCGLRAPRLTVTAVCSNIVLISNGSILPPSADEPATCDCATAALVIELRTAEDAAEEIADVIKRLLDAAADDSAEDIAAELVGLLERAAATAVELSIVDTAADDAAAEDMAAEITADDTYIEETSATDGAAVASAAVVEARVTIVDIGGKLMVE